jgi:hypothetical protein
MQAVGGAIKMTLMIAFAKHPTTVKEADALIHALEGELSRVKREREELRGKEAHATREKVDWSRQKTTFGILPVGAEFYCWGDQHLNYDYPKWIRCTKVDSRTGVEVHGCRFLMSEVAVVWRSTDDEGE